MKTIGRWLGALWGLVALEPAAAAELFRLALLWAVTFQLVRMTQEQQAITLTLVSGFLTFLTRQSVVPNTKL